MASKESRDVAALPNRVTPAMKLPAIAPFDSPETIVQALSVREPLLLTAGLVQVEKRALALVARPAPRAVADPLLDYIAKYPTADGIFSAWDLAHKTNNSQLSAAVLSSLSACIRLISTDPFSSEPEVIRRLLSKYGQHLERGLNPGRNDVTVATLKLCNVVVGFGSGRFAKRLFSCMSWSPKILARLFRTRLRDNSRDPLLKPDIRTLLTMLILAFLSSNDSRLKQDLLENKALVSGITKGLSEDPDIVVNHVLVMLWRDIIMDRSIGLEARRNVLDEPCILELIKLYDAPAPEDESASTEHHPRFSVHRLLSAITEWLGVQIHDSPARSFGPQKVLGTILRNLKITEDSQQRELALVILARAPILAGQFWSRFPASLDPRLSSRWISAVTFVTEAVSLPVYTHLIASPISTAAPPTLTTVLDTILPSGINKTWFSKALQHEAPLVSFLASLFLLASIQKATAILKVLSDSSQTLEESPSVGRWATLATQLREHLRTLLPDPQIIVALMQKTAAPTKEALAIAAKKKPSSSSKSKAKAATPDAAEPAAEDTAERHLRTNVALRLLWLYHRAVPSVIATLRFDFAKLPQAHVQPTDAEGLRAISSAYALRLAALHSGGATSSRPGDHFKNTLMPLFQLYRTPSTPSNRNLLLTILARLLSTPTLFGTNVFEVNLWLAALPKPVTSGANPVLDFFERSAQKTLTSSSGASEAPTSTTSPSLSPLLLTIVDGVSAELATVDSDAKFPLLRFVREVSLGFFGASLSAALPKAVVEKFREVIEDKATRKFLAACVKAIEEPFSPKAGEIGAEWTASSPIGENVFATFEDDMEGLHNVLSSMQTELLALHARPSDLVRPEVLAVIVEVIASRQEWAAALQVLLHRFVGVAWEVEERERLSLLITAVYQSCQDDRLKLKLASHLVGHGGLLSFFQVKKAPFSSIASLVGALLSPTAAADTALAQPFCDLVSEDLQGAGEKKSKSKAKDLPARVLAASPLLPFFDNLTALEFASTAFALIPLAGDFTPDEAVVRLLDAACLRLVSCSIEPAFNLLWTDHFLSLHHLSTANSLDSAGAVLAAGADALLPSHLSASLAVPAPSGSSTAEWKMQVPLWSEALLSQNAVSAAHAKVLAALIYRSVDARALFASWLERRASAGAEDYAEVALRALMEVGAARDEVVAIPEGIATQLVTRLFEPQLDQGTAHASVEVVQLMCLASPSVSTAVYGLLETRLPDINRDLFLSSVLELLSGLAAQSSSFSPLLDAFVNGALAGLVRRFAEDEEDTEAVSSFVGKLATAVARHGRKALYKTHLLDPLITAAITSRLGKAEPTSLAAALCANHKWKDSDVTRHLNSIFVNNDFHSVSSAEGDARKTRTAIVELATVLATASPAAAASSRFVEKLMPFYGGSCSVEDVALLDLFQRAEIVSGTSVSVAFKLWTPSPEQRPLDNSRALSLGALQTANVHRSWQRACGSITSFSSKEQDPSTYDPAFLLAYLHQTLVEDELKPADWTALLESGVLGLPVAGLASSQTSTRLVSRAVLAVALKKAQSSNFREKEEVILVLQHARNCIYSQDGEAIPSVIALFLANCMGVIGTADSTLYPAFNRFLLQRPLLDQRDVPMFYLLFYSTGDEPEEDHKWLLRFLSEALARSQDWRIFRRRQTFELLASLLQTSRTNPALRKLVLQFLLRATSIPMAAQELLTRNGLLGWLATQKPLDTSERRSLMGVIANVVDVLSHDRIGNVCDALDAVIALYGSARCERSEVLLLSKTLNKLIGRMMSSALTSSNSLRLILERASQLLHSISSHLPEDPASQIEFYRAAMLFGFAWSEAGFEETAKEKELFSRAVQAGLKAGDGALRKETLKRLSG